MSQNIWLQVVCIPEINPVADVALMQKYSANWVSNHSNLGSIEEYCPSSSAVDNMFTNGNSAF